MLNDRERPSARKQLQLRRESLRVLSSAELAEVVGGHGDAKTQVPHPTGHISGACHTAC